MNKLAIKLGAGVVSTAFLMTSFASSVFAQTDLTIEGNGVGSTNTITVKEKCKTEITQISKTKVNLNVDAKNNTGGNTIDGTTGDGNVMIDTGKASTTVNLTVTGGENSATLPDCCCDTDPALTATIAENGVDSTNEITHKKKNKMAVEQKSRTKVRAQIKARNKTGNNEILNTTGTGEVDIKTDDSSTSVTGTVTGGGNSL